MHDGYEYSSPVTVYGTKSADLGGTQGDPYAGVAVPSPFGREACEWAVQLAAFEAAGTLAISPNGKPPTVGVTNAGGTTGYMFNAPAAQIVAPQPVFTPLTNGAVYLSFNISGANVSVTLLFRRHKGHVPQFDPMFHAANPEHEQLVNQARAAAVAASESSTARTR